MEWDVVGWGGAGWAGLGHDRMGRGGVGWDAEPSFFLLARQSVRNSTAQCGASLPVSFLPVPSYSNTLQHAAVTLYSTDE